MTPDKPPVDFAKVDMLRRHMLLSVSDMAKVMGVSRMTYYTWLRGGNVRSTNVPKVKAILKKMLTIIKDGGWPSQEVLVMKPSDRLAHLLELLGQEQ